MSAAGATHDYDKPEVAASPFRSAFGRARLEALTGTASAREAEARPAVNAERPEFEYRLLKRRKKRSADEAAWNELGRKGWELVGVTGRHAAFKRRRASAD